MIIFDLAQKYGRYSHYPIRAGPDVFVMYSASEKTDTPSALGVEWKVHSHLSVRAVWM